MKDIIHPPQSFCWFRKTSPSPRQESEKPAASPVSLEPAATECAQVIEACRDMGLLVGKGGLYGHTVRFSPPMCLHEQEANFLLDVLDRAFNAV